MVEISVIFPAYNEEHRISATLKSYSEYLIQTGMSFELLVVDDGSTDNTLRLIQSLKTENPAIELLTSAINKGKGHAIRLGMLNAKGTIRLFSDADGSTPAEEIEKLIKPILDNNADISIGSRYLADSEISQAQPLIRRIWSRFANNVVQTLLLPGIVDPHCGFKAYSKHAALKIFSRCEIDGWSFDLEALAIARAENLRIEEIPVKWANDDRSKGRVSHLPKEIYNFYKIKKKLKNKVNR